MLNYIPGFRTRKKWKMVTAFFYYLTALYMLPNRLGFTILSFPFIIFGIVSAVKHSSNESIVILIFGITISFFGSNITYSPTKTVETAIVTTIPTLTPTTAPSPTITSIPSDAEETVWIGKTGTKYHYQSCNTLKGGGTEIPLSDAKAQGRISCKICNR